jgi:prolyl oligopeptidase
MRSSMTSPPFSLIEAVTDVFHGVAVTDPYRWLEDQHSPQTREWIAEQTRYARSYLDALPEREHIRERIREFLMVQTYDSVQKVGNRYFFRKRSAEQEQPCIYMRERADGEDQLLVDPAERGTGKYTSVKPLRTSLDGQLLLYEVKQGGERTGTFELFDVETRRVLTDTLPRGYLRGFAFAPDGRSFYYVHESLESQYPYHRAAYHHFLGTGFDEDQEVFSAGDSQTLRLSLISDRQRLGFLVLDFQDKTVTDFYLKSFSSDSIARPIILGATYTFAPRLVRDVILALTDRDAPNRRIVEVRLRENREPEFVDIVPGGDFPIRQWCVANEHLFVSYIRGTRTELRTFNLQGKPTDEIPTRDDETVRLLCTSQDSDELLLEAESFVEAPRIFRYMPSSGQRVPWAGRDIPFNAGAYAHKQVWYTSRDGTSIPMFLVGQKELLEKGCHPTVMTSYGGYGLPMTPQFTFLVAFLVERGVLLAIPNIRGGCEFGTQWHAAAKRLNRQTAYDDFLAAAEWVIKTDRTTSQQLGIFGGSNSGLLVAAAMTQRPDLFRAVLCMVPMLDMLRYHLFDNAHVWREEFGTSDNAEDFAAIHGYSPYHRIRPSTAYPAVMIVSGDADRNCNPLHARKMTARLQAANVSPFPVILDYSEYRGHSPVLPLSDRIEALTDRLTFLCDQLQVPI